MLAVRAPGRLGRHDRADRRAEHCAWTGRAGTRRVGGHAVVIGASVAGLLAARALAGAYERVTLVERDALPPIGEGRPAVPQGSHAHVLLASGQRALEALLPGTTAELDAAGAQSCESMREIRLRRRRPRADARRAVGADVLLASRPLIEGHIRRRVLALPNVAVRERCDAVDLLTSPDRRAGDRRAGPGPERRRRRGGPRRRPRPRRERARRARPRLARGAGVPASRRRSAWRSTCGT